MLAARLAHERRTSRKSAWMAEMVGGAAGIGRRQKPPANICVSAGLGGARRAADVRIAGG